MLARLALVTVPTVVVEAASVSNATANTINDSSVAAVTAGNVIAVDAGVCTEVAATKILPLAKAVSRNSILIAVVWSPESATVVAVSAASSKIR